MLITGVIPALKASIGQLESHIWEVIAFGQMPPCRVKPEVVMVDAATTMYKVRDGDTLNTLIAHAIDFIQRILERENNEYTVIIFDQDTPIPKYHTQKKSEIPETPFEYHDTDDPIEAWSRHFNAYIGTENRANLAYMLDSIATHGSKAPSPYEFLIPPNWRSMLDNRSCKEFLSLVFCRAIYHFTIVPEGRKLVVMGPGKFVRQRDHNSMMHVAPVFKFRRKESDFASGPIVNHFHLTHDCTIFSEDGDTLLYSLQGQSARIRSSQKNVLFDPNLFASEVWVVRHWMKEKVTYYNINNMWHTIQKHAYEVERRHKIKFTNPVATYVMLCLLNTNDYVAGFPDIGPKTLFEAFEENISKFSEPFIKNALRHDRLMINCHEILKLVLFAYSRRKKSFKFDHRARDLTAYISTVTELLPKDGNLFDLPTFKTRMANLHWFLCYMSASQRGEKSPTGVEKNDNGQPIFGYETDFKPTSTGRLHVIKSSRTSIAHLSGGISD